ncbi:general substrate transporter [Xylariaceae sp. FL0804]|nr:general substrate transporter [Xylariaceae sp. FL0804]
MGLLRLVEDRPTPRAVYNWRVYACAAVASLASCTIGYDSAFIGTTLALPSFAAEFGLDALSDPARAALSANIVSLYQAGAFFGSLAAYALADPHALGPRRSLGRRRSLWVFIAVFLLGAGIMLAARGGPGGLAPLYAGRVLAGFGVGGCSMVVPIYISELAPPAVRGRLVGMYEIGWQIGGLVGFWINYGVNTTLPASRTQWLIPVAVQLIPAGLLFLGAFWLPESPRWLFAAGRRDEALRNLCWLRRLRPDDLYLVEEVGSVDADLERYRREVGAGFWGPFAALRQRRVQWRFFLGSMLFLWQNGSGINAINYYSPTVFESIGIRGVDTDLLTTGIFGVVKTCITLVWLLALIDHVGRRPLLMAGGLGGSVCMWVLGAYICVARPTEHPTARLRGGGVAAVFFFYLWTAFYTPTWNGGPWVLNAEMFDQNTRSLGQASAAASNWFWNFIISRFTPQMFLTMGYGVYFFFASLMLLSVVFVYYLVPETRGVPLEAMDRLFEIRPVSRAHGVVLGEVKARDEEFRRGVEEGAVHLDEKAAVQDRQEAV